MAKLAYTAILLALTTTVASAQSPAPPAARILTNLPADNLTVTHWYKQNVYDLSDSKIGEIMDVLVDREGKIGVLIVGVGGFVGVGEKDVAVPFNAVQFKTKDNNKWYPVMNTTKDALKTAPGYKYDRTTTMWMPENAPATTGISKRPETPSAPGPNSR
jgi:sporulation protein YlmC with PRC-barrel domain